MYTSWMGIGGDDRMTYKQALEEARNGKWISRSGWENLFGWYHIRMDTNNYLIMVDPLNGELHGHMGAGTTLFPKELHFHHTCWMQALSNARTRSH